MDDDNPKNLGKARGRVVLIRDFGVNTKEKIGEKDSKFVIQDYWDVKDLKVK